MSRMMLDDAAVEQYGEELFCAMTGCKVVRPLTERISDISIEDAYRISQHYLALRLARNNEQVIGKKIGVTSEAVQSMLGVYEPDFGFLTDAMRFNEGDVPIGHLIQPRAEAEMAFLLKEDLVGPDITKEQVLSATEAVMACFEIVDSRIDNWQIRIQDTVADNASCGIFVVSDQKVDPESLNLADSKVTVEKNGAFLSEGQGSAVQGSPLQSIAWLAGTLGQFGTVLKAGEIILSGSLVPLESVVIGDRMAMTMPGIGELDIRFVEHL